MAMGNMGNSTMKHHKMWMWYHTKLQDTVLFDFWTIDSVGEMIWSCAIVFIVAFLLEALKYWRLILENRAADIQ
jgi:hypothetical protein